MVVAEAGGEATEEYEEEGIGEVEGEGKEEGCEEGVASVFRSGHLGDGCEFILTTFLVVSYRVIHKCGI